MYSDGNIALPTMHDFILFAGMYKKLSEENKVKVNSVVEWVFDEQYKNISRRYGYFYVPGGTYNVKAVIFKMHLVDFKNMIFDKSDISGLIYTCFVLSHFDSAKSSEWFNLAMVHLNNYKSLDNHYIFPGYMINEKKDSYVINGEHMNIGENRRSKQYSEIVSTYWMERIYRNLSE
ncbi:hypothetical protein LJC63_12315 [Ruminococcaceae bacterium OttesenSCG-928-L11]|nr:hypothetical protein [Ruminococcaceae bacterium OttesenSCG-928-L11]